MLRKKHPKYKGFTKSMLRRLLPGIVRPYYRKVWSIERDNLIAYWPLWEICRLTAIDISGNSADGNLVLAYSANLGSVMVIPARRSTARMIM